MTLFLTSSPCVPEASRAVLNPANGFVERLRAALPEQPRCLYICSDPDGYELTDYYGNEMAEAFTGAGIEFKEFVTLDHRNGADTRMLLWKSDLVILAGGHVPTQNAFFREIGLKELLKDYQGVVMGISAGTMNAAREVYAQPEREGESEDPAYQRFLPGLGLTDIRMLPHYQQCKDDILDGKRLFEEITYMDSIGRTFFAFPDGTYYYQAGTSTVIFGECYRIRDCMMKKVCEEGRALFEIW